MEAIKTESLIQTICECAEEKKADDIVIIDMRKKTAFFDYFIVMGASSTARVRAIVDNIQTNLRKAGSRAIHRDGYPECQWVLLDYHEVLVHVFHHEVRDFYSLETLWGDAPAKKFIRQEER